MSLRPYQAETINLTYDWMRNNKGKNPCIVLPTGSGKSHIIAQLAKDAVQNWPGTHILVLAAQKELLEQNAEKLRQAWPNAPIGMYSASLGQKVIDTITFASIQSIYKRAKELGHIDLCIIDECHLVSHTKSGQFRTFLEELNPTRVIGFTATPYRLGHGYIHEGEDPLFHDLLANVTIERLVREGYLATLRSKVTELKLDTTGVGKRHGDYIESQLQAAVDTQRNNAEIVSQVISLAGDRRSWLFFCAGVAHALHVRDELRSRGISAETVTGDTPQGQRSQILSDFKAGRIQAVTNANVLTTGFDAPNIDLIAMLRPTASPTLYVQMAGRGMRLKEHTDHCLVLDFAGVVDTHGPITYVEPPNKSGSGNGEAPVKVCPNCDELCHLSVMTCPACGHVFVPEQPDKNLKLHDSDIMGLDSTRVEVTDWRWTVQNSRSNGIPMLVCSYYSGLSAKPVREYYCINHGGFAQQKAMRKLSEVLRRADIASSSDLDDLNQADPPKAILTRRDGKFTQVISKEW